MLSGSNPRPPAHGANALTTEPPLTYLYLDIHYVYSIRRCVFVCVCVRACVRACVGVRACVNRAIDLLNVKFC